MPTESGNPGYGLYDRARGAVYLNGLWEGMGKGEACGPEHATPDTNTSTNTNASRSQPT